MRKSAARITSPAFPIRLDDAVMETDQAWAADIRRTRHIGDFRNWKDHDAYQNAFARLLRDLKAENPPPPTRRPQPLPDSGRHIR